MEAKNLRRAVLDFDGHKFTVDAVDIDGTPWALVNMDDLHRLLKCALLVAAKGGVNLVRPVRLA